MSILICLLTGVAVMWADDSNPAQGKVNLLLNIPPGYRALEGSENKPTADVKLLGPAAPDETLALSLYVRRRSGSPSTKEVGDWTEVRPMQRKYLTQEEYAQINGASPQDLDRVITFAKGVGLTLKETDAARRVVVVSGTVDQVNRAFAIRINRYESAAGSYLGYDGQVYVPADLMEVIEGVFGLDARPVAHPIPQEPAGGTIGPLTPPQVARLYDFPGVRANGETIGLLEFGGGYRESDIKEYFDQVVHLPVPDVKWVGVDGAVNQVGSDADVEVMLDISVAGAVAPGAKIVVYFGPNTYRGWVDAVTTAIQDTIHNPAILSLSWGAEEYRWSSPARTKLSDELNDAASLGITFFAASGDEGSERPAAVFYPASDPSSTSCGGTSVENVSETSCLQTAWAGSGGGISNTFPLPAWQRSAGIPFSVNPPGRVGRGIPDVCGNADFRSGYILILNGRRVGPKGGTSAVAPLYAGLVAQLNASLHKRVGNLNGTLYDSANCDRIYHDVISGSNGEYHAGQGWDAVTGWGSVNGRALLEALR